MSSRPYSRRKTFIKFREQWSDYDDDDDGGDQPRQVAKVRCTIIYRVTYWNLEVNSVSKEAVCIHSAYFDLFEANIPLNETVTQYSAPTTNSRFYYKW